MLHYLLEPFANETEARQFWQDTATQFIYIEASDTADTLAQLCQPLRQRIAYSLHYPEHSFTLLSPYELSLSILSDDGKGVYLLRHKDNGLVVALEGRGYSPVEDKEDGLWVILFSLFVGEEGCWAIGQKRPGL